MNVVKSRSFFTSVIKSMLKTIIYIGSSLNRCRYVVKIVLYNIGFEKIDVVFAIFLIFSLLNETKLYILKLLLNKNY